MNLIRWFSKQWLAILIAGLCGITFLFAHSMPVESLFVWQDRADKLLIVILGGIYLLVKLLPVAAGLLMILVVVFGVIAFVRELIRARRLAVLIPLVVLYGANCVVFSAPGLVFSRSVGEKVVDCEMFITARSGLRIVRYPVDVRMDYAEQQFFLMTFDGGQTWEQFLQVFTYYPSLEKCQFVQSFEGDNGVLWIEHTEKPGEFKVVRYITTDGGHTWQKSG